MIRNILNDAEEFDNYKNVNENLNEYDFKSIDDDFENDEGDDLKFNDYVVKKEPDRLFEQTKTNTKMNNNSILNPFSSSIFSN